MGHAVCHFDHREQAARNKDGMNDAFLALVRGGRFDLVLVESSSDEFYEEVLDEARQYSTTVLFDSDDDFRWLDSSAVLAPRYSWVVTTYRHVYEAVRPSFPNVLLSQWAATGWFVGDDRRRDIPLSFVGGIHASRAQRLAALRRRAPIEVYGHGAGRVDGTASRLALIASNALRGGGGSRRALLDWLALRITGESIGIDYETANSLWCRTKVSFTPLDLADSQYEQKLAMARRMKPSEAKDANSPWTSRYQIKGRVFEMGTTGTVMLCDRNPALDEFYERGTEYFDFECLEECVEKARFLTSNDRARRRIAEAYKRRTLREHLWSGRLSSLFRQALDIGP